MSRGARWLLTACRHGRARQRQAGARAAVSLWGEGRGGGVAESRLRRLDDGRYEYSPKKGTTFTVTAARLVRRLVALLPPERLHLTSFPRRLRTQRPPAAPHHPTACAFATSADAQRDTGDEGFSACETDAAAARLGPASPAHLRHRRVALPLWRKAHHQAPPFHPQAGRSPPHRARRHLALAGAAASHRAAAVVALDVKPTSRLMPTSSSPYRCARSTPTPTHLGRNGLADPRAADFRSAPSSLGHQLRLSVSRFVFLCSSSGSRSRP